MKIKLNITERLVISLFFSMGLFQSKSNDIFLSLQENICLVLIRSATQSLMSTHNLCFLGGMRKKIFLYSYFAVFSFDVGH